LASLRTYVALLRAVNLGSRNQVSMGDLRTLFVDLGGEDVTTYVQSGNVVFKSRIADAGKLTDTIERRIRRELDLDITVLLRTKAQLARVAAANPFESREPEPTKLHVTFLADAPTRGRVRTLETLAFPPDEFRVVGKQVYLHTQWLRKVEAQRRLLREAAGRPGHDPELEDGDEAGGARCRLAGLGRAQTSAAAPFVTEPSAVSNSARADDIASTSTSSPSCWCARRRRGTILLSTARPCVVTSRK
jgi:uncharacterized protein (DUF1697 family)